MDITIGRESKRVWKMVGAACSVASELDGSMSFD
jgi:hypothetical protein